MQGSNTMTKLNTHRIKKNLTAGLEVITAVVMKSSIFWDIMMHSLLKINNPFQKNNPSLSSGSKNKLLYHRRQNSLKFNYEHLLAENVLSYQFCLYKTIACTHFHDMAQKHSDMMPLSIFTKPSCLPNFCY
jgi:hypothetical protein